MHVLRAEPGAPVRLRVLLVHHEPWWDQDDLLPDGPAFFVQVLREAADGSAGRPEGPLAAEIGLLQSLDAGWITAEAHRFVERAERVAVRNLPVGEDLAAYYRDEYDPLDDLFYASTFNGMYRPGEHARIEQRLVQADYDVQVTDPRWTQTLKAGQAWGTAAWGPLATAGEAALRLGFLSADDEGARDGAIAAYRRAIEIGDAPTRVEALLYLDELPAGREYDIAERNRAALDLCVRLAAEGRDEDAHAAYAKALLTGGAEVAGEARRRAGLAGPAEHGLRLFTEEGPSRAAAWLRAAYDDGSSDVAAFALAVYARDFDRAGEIMGGLGGDLVLSWSGRVAMEMAFLHARAGDGDAARALLDLAYATGFAPSLFAEALDSGAARPAALATEIGKSLVEDLVNPAYDDEIETIVAATEGRLPDLAAFACQAQIDCHRQYDQTDEAEAWETRLPR
ncbi:hypothetical protein E1293_40895 [Actinomadura darangshiensis]|uniref:Uncharacterized protein n=1 Tax=Actinomadura darangshiensis TaxID=705336 RepID=A0A4R5A1Z4_9ACTN|nr:hypothetical protein [Actinomadura darangshiensis]TDD64970.1 hypothetical protein E1293_40895 [Actinomadura darangshiensis]